MAEFSPVLLHNYGLDWTVKVRHWDGSMDWYRSKSTTRLHSEDSEDSCSTLSDEDSTPHVSRSNSYGRSEEHSYNQQVGSLP